MDGCSADDTIRRGRRTRTRAEQDNSSNENTSAGKKADYANRHGMALLVLLSLLLSLSFSVAAIMRAPGIMRMLCGCGMLKL